MVFLADRIAKYANKQRSKRLNLKKGDKVYLLRRYIKIRRLSDKLDFKKISLFRVEKKLRPVIFKLKLPTDIKIYPVFYVVLLE